MWSNPTAVYRLIGCHQMVVLGCGVLPEHSGKYIFHIIRRRACKMQVQDIVSAMTKAWKCTSHRLHQIHIWWFFICLCDVKHKFSIWKTYTLFQETLCVNGTVKKTKIYNSEGVFQKYEMVVYHLSKWYEL